MIIHVVKYMATVYAVVYSTRWVAKKLGLSDIAASAIGMGLGSYAGRSYIDKQRKGGRA